MTIKTLFLAAALAVPAIAAPASAQVGGVGVADLQAAVANTKAWTAARAQIQTTYKAQIDQAEARRAAITAELQPLATKFQADQKANVAQATLQGEYTTIQSRQQAAQAELARITAPAERAQGYALEQISSHLNEAVQAAMRTRNVSLLLRPEGVASAQPAADVTAAVTTELDRVVPSVSITPPANWQPGQAGQSAPAASAPAARSTGRSTGR